MSGDGRRTGDATVSFSQRGVQPPVFIVTSLTGWIPLEMDVQQDQTEDGHLVFTKQFPNVPEGPYQYKIRIGDNQWVVDESKDSGMT